MGIQMSGFLVDATFFFFKQKTAYVMRISDWSSDVCSSDLHAIGCRGCILRLFSQSFAYARCTIYFADDFLFEQGAVVLPRLQFLLGLILGKRRVHDFGFYDSHTQDRSSKARGSCPTIRAPGEAILNRLYVRGGKQGKKKGRE